MDKSIIKLEYADVYGQVVPDRFMIDKFNRRANSISDMENLSLETISKFLEKFNEEITFYSTREIFSKPIYNVHIFMESRECFIALTSKNRSSGIYSYEATIHYIDLNKIEDIISFLSSFIKVDEKECKIYLIGRDSNGGYCRYGYDLKFDDINLEINYNKEIIESTSKIINHINSNNKTGILLLHGIPGTGKTSYIRYLLKNVNKDVLFLPNILINDITSPSMIDFMYRSCKNSIIVLEDAEELIASREFSGERSAISTILNMTDGILGDILGVAIICTFNTKLKNIDNALLRQGRLIAELEFKELTSEKSNMLLKHIGKNHITSNPLTLGEIYNIDEPRIITDKANKSIGFNR